MFLSAHPPMCNAALDTHQLAINWWRQLQYYACRAAISQVPIERPLQTYLHAGGTWWHSVGHPLHPQWPTRQATNGLLCRCNSWCHKNSFHPTFGGKDYVPLFISEIPRYFKSHIGCFNEFNVSNPRNVFSPAAPLTLDPWYPHIPLYSIPLNCPFPIIFYGYILGLHSQAHEKNLRPGRPRPQHSTRNLGIVCVWYTNISILYM